MLEMPELIREWKKVSAPSEGEHNYIASADEATTGRKAELGQVPQIEGLLGARNGRVRTRPCIECIISNVQHPPSTAVQLLRHSPLGTLGFSFDMTSVQSDLVVSRRTMQSLLDGCPRLVQAHRCIFRASHTDTSNLHMGLFSFPARYILTVMRPTTLAHTGFENHHFLVSERFEAPICLTHVIKVLKSSIFPARFYSSQNISHLNPNSPHLTSPCVAAHTEQNSATMASTGIPQPTYYTILGLSPSVTSQQDDPGQLIKRAYRRALLNHHPDKKRQPPPPPPNAPPNTTTTTHKTNTFNFTVDQISTAYAILSNPTSRATYDKHLQHQSSIPGANNNNNNTAHHDFQTGIETVDLDDLSVSVGSISPQEVVSESTTTATTNEGEAVAAAAAAAAATQEQWWYRSCRCGNPQGYRFTETDLEEAIDLGELMVGCVDCSLWLRVLFSVVVEEDKDDDDDDDEEESQTR